MFFFGMLRAMERLECMEMEHDTTLPLYLWRTENDQAGLCPVLNTLIVTDNNYDVAKHRVRELEQVRKIAGVPISRVFIGLWPDSGR